MSQEELDLLARIPFDSLPYNDKLRYTKQRIVNMASFFERFDDTSEGQHREIMLSHCKTLRQLIQTWFDLKGQKATYHVSN